MEELSQMKETVMIEAAILNLTPGLTVIVCLSLQLTGSEMVAW